MCVFGKTIPEVCEIIESHKPKKTGFPGKAEHKRQKGKSIGRADFQALQRRRQEAGKPAEEQGCSRAGNENKPVFFRKKQPKKPWSVGKSKGR